MIRMVGIVLGQLKLSAGLDSAELAAVRQLETECCGIRQLNMKLNWDMLENRSADEINDLLYYEGERLVGFMGLYSMSKEAKEIEITGMVHPEFRRKGIFRQLFNAALMECRDRKAKKVLLITERTSDEGVAFARAIQSEYSSSEYRMKFSEVNAPDFPGIGIILRKAEYSDYPELARMDEAAFGQVSVNIAESKAEDDRAAFKKAYSSAYIAKLDVLTIGKIGTLMDGGDGYIFGFVVKPEYRGRGFGREILSLMLKKLTAEKIDTVLLEVAVSNEKALSLYETCGFKRITVYDYYKIDLSE